MYVTYAGARNPCTSFKDYVIMRDTYFNPSFNDVGTWKMMSSFNPLIILARVRAQVSPRNAEKLPYRGLAAVPPFDLRFGG